MTQVKSALKIPNRTATGLHNTSKKKSMRRISGIIEEESCSASSSSSFEGDSSDPSEKIRKKRSSKMIPGPLQRSSTKVIAEKQPSDRVEEQPMGNQIGVIRPGIHTVVEVLMKQSTKPKRKVSSQGTMGRGNLSSQTEPVSP
jgi:hypothetical protein